MKLKAINDENTGGASSYLGEDMLHPAKTWYVLLGLFVALILNLIPLENIFYMMRPDFVAIILLYWSINQPEKIGLSLAFAMGLLMDVGHASVLGQHALAYCVVVYLTSTLHRRLRIFSLFQQAPQIGVILLIMQTIIVVIELLSNNQSSGWILFLSVLTSTICWPPIAYLISLPLKPEPDPNEL